MRGIPEDKAIEIGEQIDSCKYLECSVKEWLRDECQELNPWLTLEEFLKSGFEGSCWVAVRSGSIYQAVKIGCKFIDDLSLGTHIYPINITHVQPIHKPEPPR